MISNLVKLWFLGWMMMLYCSKFVHLGFRLVTGLQHVLVTLTMFLDGKGVMTEAGFLQVIAVVNILSHDLIIFLLGECYTVPHVPI